MQSKSKGQDLSLINLQMDAENAIISRQGKAIKLDEVFTPDPNFVKFISDYKLERRKIFSASGNINPKP